MATDLLNLGSNIFKSCLVCIIIVLTVAQLRSQEITGDLAGWVFESDSKPLPDVDITVFSPSLQGHRGAASNQAGYFHIVALPVGEYKVKISHLAYHNVIYKDVNIRLGKTTTLGQIVMKAKTLEMPVVTVTARRPDIDPTTTSNGLNLAYEDIDPLPINRDYQSLVTLAPQANTSFYGDAVNISGSTGLENVYYIEGMNATDPHFALGSTNLPYNFVKELEVKTGGYEAEYGSALGGVINVITHSGGDQLAGNAFGYFTNNNFAGERRTGIVASNVQGFSLYDFGFNLNGPVIQDKLWFYSAYNPNFEIENIKIPGLGTFQDKRISHIFAGKLNWKASDKTNIVFSAFGDPSRHNLIRQFDFAQQMAIENEDVILGLSEGGGINLSLNGKSIISEKFLIETNLAHLRRRSNYEGETERGRTEPLFIDLETGTWSGGAGFRNNQTWARSSAVVKASFYLGKHTLKIGSEYEDNSSKLNFYTIGPGGNGDQTEGGLGFIFRINDSLYQASAGITKAKVHNRIPALFIQDAWQLNQRLLLQLGVRWSGEYMIGSDGKVAQTIEDELQPRIGFVYQRGELGSQKIYGSFGRFYEKIPTALSSTYHVNAQQLLISYDHNPLDNPTGGDTLSLSTSIAPEVKRLEGQYFDEFTLGFERAVSNRSKLGIRGIYRTIRQVVEDIYNPELGEYVLGNPGKGNLSLIPQPIRKYAALEASFQKFAEKGLTFFVTYVLSRNYGNYGGLFNQDSGGSLPNASPVGDLVEQYPNSTGLLPNDRTHVFKFWGSYRFKFGLNVGSTFIWQSGTPLNNFGGTSIGFPYFSFVQKRGTAGRTPAIWDLGLRFSYDFPIYPSSLDAKIILDLLHIGSPRKAVTFDQIHYFAIDEDGNQIQENPNYLEPIRFQSPTTFRLGMEVGF